MRWTRHKLSLLAMILVHRSPYYCALLRPDIFRAVALLSVPYLQRPWNAPRTTEAMKRMAGEKQFYQLYFQEPGKAEADLEADVRKTTLMVLYSLSGDAPPEKRWRYLFEKNERFIDTVYLPESSPSRLTEADIEMYTRTFQQTGDRGGLNWYRNIDRNWECTAFLTAAKISQPSMFVAGEMDAVVKFRRSAFDALEQTMPNLRKKGSFPWCWPLDSARATKRSQPTAVRVPRIAITGCMGARRDFYTPHAGDYPPA